LEAGRLSSGHGKVRDLQNAIRRGEKFNTGATAKSFPPSSASW
jgi:hypothetical protein